MELANNQGHLVCSVPSSTAESFGAKCCSRMTAEEKMSLFALEMFVGSSLWREGGITQD